MASTARPTAPLVACLARLQEQRSEPGWDGIRSTPGFRSRYPDARLVSRGLLVFVGRVFIARRALGEQGRRAERIVAAESTFDDDVDTVGKGVGRDAAVDDVIRLRAVGHLERDLAAAGIAHDRAIHDSRADLDASLVESRIRSRLRRQLTGSQVVDSGVADGAGGQIARGADHEYAADDEFAAWLHEWNIWKCSAIQERSASRDQRHCLSCASISLTSRVS